MEAIARYNNIRISPRKTRKVVDLIRAMSVAQAIKVLRHMPQKAAPYVIDVLKSAVANLNHRHQGKPLLSSAIVIKEIYVNMGSVLKRIQPAPQGRAHPIRKPSAHIFVKVFLDEALQSKAPALPKGGPAPLSGKKKVATSPKKLPASSAKGDSAPEKAAKADAQPTPKAKPAPKPTPASVKAKAQAAEEGTPPKSAANSKKADAPKAEAATATPAPPKAKKSAQPAETKKEATPKKASLDTEKTTKK